MRGFGKRFAIMWLMFISAFSYAQSTLQLIDSNEIVRLSKHFQILKESNDKLTIDEVRQAKGQFYRDSNLNPNYGYSDNGIWLNVNFSNVTDTKNWVIDLGYAQTDVTDFYLFSGDELLAMSKQGRLSEHQDYRFPTLEAELPFATTLELFVRVESSATSIIAPIDIQSKRQHTRAKFFDNIIWGFFYGSLIILALVNLIQYPSNREKSLLAYSVFVFSVVIWHLGWGGHVHMLFPAQFSHWVANHVSLLFIAIAFSGGIFSAFFLNVRENAPKSTVFIEFSLIALGILTLCTVFSLFPLAWLNGLVFGLSMFAVIAYLIAGFESYLNDFQPAKYFIFAWSILTCGALFGILNLLGIMPSNPFTNYCFQISIFIHAGLCSIALMDKIRSELEMEIQQATNDLRNNMEFIEEQNARLDIARKDAIKASHVKSQFLANMSHEIRTPLNAILGFSKELNQLSLSEENQEQVRIINAAADNLLGIVNDVLDVSKIEAGKLQINNHPFSPNQLVEEMVSVMAKSAHQKHLEFVLDLCPLPDKLIGDVMRIRQILNNLLSNALKFTPTGHICSECNGNNQGTWTFRIKDQSRRHGYRDQCQRQKKAV